jgi:hypothetical protein
MSDAPRHSVPVPQHMAGLPRDERGYIVPWFVAWHDGRPQDARP